MNIELGKHESIKSSKSKITIPQYINRYISKKKTHIFVECSKDLLTFPQIKLLLLFATLHTEKYYIALCVELICCKKLRSSIH